MKDRIDFKIELKWQFFKNRLQKIMASTKRNLKRDKTAMNICISMFIVNNVIFSTFFVEKEEENKTNNLMTILGAILGFLLVPTIFFTGIRCDSSSPWATLMILYFSLIISMLFYGLHGEGNFLRVMRTIGFTGTVTSLFNIYMMNLIILSKSVSRECRALMYGCCCGVGAFGAVLGLTLGQVIMDGTNSQTLYILEILLCIAYIILYYSIGGKK
jgi:hypothetical protein